MTVGLKINIGPSIENVVPTIEDCLKDNDGEFYSAQNAVCIHEWMGGSSTLPPVLKKVKGGGPDTRTLGSGQVRYPQLQRVGDFTRAEQALLASEKVGLKLRELLSAATESASPAARKAVTQTYQNMRRIMDPIYKLNASCMFHDFDMPKHMKLESLEVLDMVVDMVLTQRKRSVFQTNETLDVKLDENLYLKKDLEMVLIEIHKSGVSGIFQAPDTLVLEHSLLDANAMREMASAISMSCNYVIPEDWHCKTPLTKIYFWARTVLRSKVDGIEQAVVRPKPVGLRVV